MRKVLSLVAFATFILLAFGSKGNPEYRNCYDRCVDRKNKKYEGMGGANTIDLQVCAENCAARHK